MTAATKQKRPAPLELRPENIPTELRQLDQWVLWKYKWKDDPNLADGGKWDKPPLTATGSPASSTDPQTWTTYASALDAYEWGSFDGVGFVLTMGDPYVGVDLDKCVTHGVPDEWVDPIIDSLDSYTEFSPSDSGVRIFVRGQLPEGRRKVDLVEMYESGRYLTITGHIIGDQRTVEPRQDAINIVHKNHLAEQPKTPDQTTTVSVPSNLSDDELLEKAFNAKNGAKFKGCWNGDNSHTEDGSPSGGDMSLCMQLAFWTGKNADQIDRIFRSSPRMRSKWDEKHGEHTYGQKTIGEAIDRQTEIYEPPNVTKLVLPSSRPPQAEQAARLEKTRQVFRKWLYLPDDDHVLTALGAVAANLIDGDPLWILFVGPPGSGKTEVVQPLAGLDYVHPAATLTEPALLSGVPKRSYEKGSTGGLLKQIGDFGIILTKDFSGVLSMYHDARAAVLAALREVFDGSWSRPVGTGGGRTLHWEGKAGLIGAVTPTIDRHSAVMGALGERFVLYRLDESDTTTKTRQAIDNFGNQKTMREELAVAAKTALENIGHYPAKPLLENDKDRLVRIAGFAVKARTAVERDGYRRTVQTIPEHEHSTRLVLQLAQLRAGLLEIGADDETAWRIVTKAGFDSIPRLRWLILTALRGATDWQTNADLVKNTGIPRKTLEEHAEDLDLLGLIDRKKDGTAANASWMQRLADGVTDSWPDEVGEKSRTDTEQPITVDVSDPFYNPIPVMNDFSRQQEVPLVANGDLGLGVHNGVYCRCGNDVAHYTKDGFPFCDECGPPE